MSDPGSEPPPPPRDIQNLLRICMANAEYNGEVERSEETDRQWLAEALVGLTTDVIREMVRHKDFILKELNDVDPSTGLLSQETVEQVEETIDSLIDLTGSIDNANDFFKIGGFDIFPLLFSSRSNTLKAKGAELLAEIVQNNSVCQKHAIQSNFLKPLVDLLDKSDDENVRIKSLYALSCLIRESEEAQDIFEHQLNGFSILLGAMQSDGPSNKLRIKSSFLISSLTRQRPQLIDGLFNMGFVVQLIGLLHSEHDQSHEHLMAALHAIISQHQPSLLECRRTELGLESLLKNRIEMIKDKNEFLEETEFCKEILRLCFNSEELPETER